MFWRKCAHKSHTQRGCRKFFRLSLSLSFLFSSLVSHSLFCSSQPRNRTSHHSTLINWCVINCFWNINHLHLCVSLNTVSPLFFLFPLPFSLCLSLHVWIVCLSCFSSFSSSCSSAPFISSSFSAESKCQTHKFSAECRFYSRGKLSLQQQAQVSTKVKCTRITSDLLILLVNHPHNCRWINLFVFLSLFLCMVTNITRIYSHSG